MTWVPAGSSASSPGAAAASPVFLGPIHRGGALRVTCAERPARPVPRAALIVRPCRDVPVPTLWHDSRVGGESGFASFEDFARVASGFAPYPYQSAIARDGLPEVLEVPTGAGKTLAAVLPWLWRRRYAEPVVRANTPHWLVFVLPMRVLVEQSHGAIVEWVERVGLADEVDVHRVMGGEPRADDWRRSPERDAIFVGTLDMLLSRALNRGYGVSRFSWPIDFGLFNHDTQWVFDEVQLMGPALPTSRQLQAFRESFGTSAPTASMWMSATVDGSALLTIDRPAVSARVALDPDDFAGPLQLRLESRKLVRKAEDVATAAMERHRSGSLTLCIVNTVERSQEVYRSVSNGGAEVVLLHSRFRPGARAQAVKRALAAVDPSGPGRIVVSTQVVEAGVDISAAVMVTEAAPWPSVIQRAGRCNRAGLLTDAEFWWVEPAKPGPYEGDEVAATVAALGSLEGCEVTPVSISKTEVPVAHVVHPVLRRRDIVDLFDTAPDVSGNDVDVSRFIRSGDDIDAMVAWREFGDEPGDSPMPTAAELCAVPIGSLLGWSKSKALFVHDHLAGGWRRVGARDVRPGRVYLAGARDGGYDEELGWDSKARGVVAPVTQEEDHPLVSDDELDLDPITFVGRWVALADHLADVEADVRAMVGGLRCTDLADSILEAAAVAGRLHDIGKAHPSFQEMLRASTADEAERARLESGGPWAKSASRRGPRCRRWHLRHELVSALMLLAEPGVELLDRYGVDADLVRYLVAAHHGRVRLSIRSMPGERNGNNPEGRVALGVWEGDEIAAVQLPAGELAATRLSLATSELGESDGVGSWTARVTALRDREDLGPFRLAFCEALVRLADWRVSASYEEAVHA